MSRLLCFTLLLIGLTARPLAQDEIILTEIATGFNTPVDIVHAGDDRLFVVEKRGVIRIMDTTGQVMADPFLDIDLLVNSTSSERGLLGLAFHPDYAENGYLYVNYTNVIGSTVIERYTRDSTNAHAADPASGKVLLVISQPFPNHNAGDLAFGPDGYLYIGTGDGGSGGDPGDRAQDPLRLLGKMLRIDVDNGDPYSIPPDNPFADTDAALDEIWAIGLRNPWRYSFDRTTGDLYIADVGQNAWEEVNFQMAGAPGGQNYGWRCYEGNAAFNTSGCPDSDSLTFPVFAYPHEGFNCAGSVTGGFVYRGSRHPGLVGTYIMADYCKGSFRGFRMEGGEAVDQRVLAQLDQFEYTSFGEDASGEIYVAGASGRIYRLEQTPVSSIDNVRDQQWRVFPVPATEDMYLQAHRDLTVVGAWVAIYNLLGHQVFRSALPTDGRVSVAELAPGIYWAVISWGGSNEVLRFVVQ